MFPISAKHLCLPVGPEHLFIACETERAETDFRALDPRYVMFTINDMVTKRARSLVYGKDDSQSRFVANRFGKEAATLPF